jgi:hypothetical protein
MKFLYVLMLVVSTRVIAGDLAIDAAQSGVHIGKAVVACGLVTEVKPFAKGVYLSYGPRFPKQHLTGVVWQDDVQNFVDRFGDLSRLTGRNVCLRGKVSTYKGQPQIELVGPDSLRLTK